ncbi:hypothetical protein JXL21_00840 [Candidatus Bathyarchaeota archaeon]|nr:hypothetical protein [Candidatus Bathyarchaeota archaeon]
MNKVRRCAFIETRRCPVDVDEIPLDVCRLCINAWKTSAEIQALTGAQVVPEAITIQRPIQTIQASAQTQQGQAPPIIELSAPSRAVDLKETYSRIHRLDAMFINDGIDAEEYVRRRRGLVNQMAKDKSINLPEYEMELISLDESLEISSGVDFKPFKRVLPLLLLEPKQVGVNVTKISGNRELPTVLSKANIRSILGVYEDMGEDKRMLIQFNGTKLGLLGRKRNKILCMVLEGDESVEDYEEEINYLTELLSETEDFNEFLRTLSAALNKQNISQELP